MIISLCCEFAPILKSEDNAYLHVQMEGGMMLSGSAHALSAECPRMIHFSVSPAHTRKTDTSSPKLENWYQFVLLLN